MVYLIEYPEASLRVDGESVVTRRGGGDEKFMMRERGGSSSGGRWAGELRSEGSVSSNRHILARMKVPEA